MMKVKDSYNSDAISIVAATAAIEDQEYASGELGARARTSGSADRRADAMGWSVLPSQANFIWPPRPDGQAGGCTSGSSSRASSSDTSTSRA